MGAGIAKQIKKQFPEACEEDCKTKKGDKNWEHILLRMFEEAIIK